MWHYISYCQAFFVITNAVLQPKANVQTKPHHEVESAFADVMKNISRVNNVLQELIHNYERLQKIYESQETVGSEYTSDTEIDEVFKSASQKKSKKVRSKNTSTTKKQLNNNFQPATEIIWSDIEKPGDNDKKENRTKGREPQVQSLQAVKSIDRKPKGSFEFSSDSDSDENVMQKPGNYKFSDTVTNKKLNKNQHNNKSSKVEMKLHSNTEVPRSRHYKIQPSYPIGNNNNKAHIEPRLYLREGNLTNSIAMIQTAKGFASKLFKNANAIKYNVSIKSHTLNEPFYRTRNDSGKKTALILIKNDILVSRSGSKDNSSAEDDQAINKELFRTNVLREAYGDACLKVVVKKCFKACKSAIKESCRDYRCKSEFKSKFISHSKTGCIMEFKKRSGDNDSISRSCNLRTDGNLEAACSEDYKSNRVSLRNATPFILTKVSNGDENVNILRDRYEKACKQRSRQKCRSACDYAVKETCSAYDCRSGRKKKLHRNCKRECKRSYNARSSYSRHSKHSRDKSSSSRSSDSGSISDSSSF